MYESEAKIIAAELAKKFGKLLEVRLGPGAKIVLTFEHGQFQVPPLIPFKYGYMGSGPDCFHAFLEASDFRIPKSQIQDAKGGEVLRRMDIEQRQAEESKRKQAEETKRRQEAEAGRLPEEQKQREIQAQRKSAAQCVMCGRALGFFQKLFGKDRHGACTVFINTPSTTTAAPKASVAPSLAKQPGMVLFLFNSDTPPADTNVTYGTFSESRLLKHLFARWSAVTGQYIGNAVIKACHGDLFERHPLGESACTLKKLGKMMQDGRLDGSRLRAEFDLALRKGATIGFIPWAIGLCPVPDSVTAAVHEALKAELPEFYLGVVSLPPSQQFEPTATNLALPQTMRIQKGQLVGDWQGKAL